MRTQRNLATLNHLFFHSIETFQRERLLTFGLPDRLVTYSSSQFAHSVLALRGFLLSSGLADGDRVAILAENRPEWSIADFAILLAGMVVVPLYPDLSAAQIRVQLRHSGCRAICVSGVQRTALIREIAASLPNLGPIVALDDEAGGCVTARLSEIAAAAAPFVGAELAKIRAAALAVDAGTLASIVYTSGTTGTPKGVMLSHGNIVFDLERCLERLQFRTVRQALSILPLSHVFERLMCYGYFRLGIPVAYGHPHALKELLRLHRPSVVASVPRVIEKFQEAIEAEVRKQPLRRQRLFRSMLDSALACTRRTRVPVRVPLRHRLLHQVAKAVVFRRIRARLGGLQYIVCGGAWLNPAAEDFIRALGIIVVQGYGLTETAPVICLSRLGHERSGSVGAPLDGIEVEIDEDREIRTRGPNVTKGYYLDPEATAAAFCNGWLRTGDLGRFDDEGNLIVTGRLKEVIVLSTGKNVCPSAAEEALRSSPLIENVVGIGDGRRFMSALIVPHRPNVEALARSLNLGCSGFDALLKEPGIVSAFREALVLHQKDLAAFERVKRFRFLGEDALANPELITPTQKIRRQALERHYAEYIEGMYSQEEDF
jgi:long-chain acyl-CoA synthetase